MKRAVALDLDVAKLRQRVRSLLTHNQSANHLVDIKTIREIVDFHAARFARSSDTNKRLHLRRTPISIQHARNGHASRIANLLLVVSERLNQRREKPLQSTDSCLQLR